MQTTISHENAVKLLEAFIRDPARFDRADYDSVFAFRADVSKAESDGRKALTALLEFEHLPFDPVKFAAAFDAFSGRLSLTQDGDRFTLDYTAGQYYPLEVKAAVLAVLVRYNQAARPKPAMTAAPELDALYRDLASIGDYEAEKKLRSELLPRFACVTHFVYGFDKSFEDWLITPACGIAEAKAIANFYRSCSDMTGIHCDPVTAHFVDSLKPRQLMLDWRYHALDVTPPQPVRPASLEK